MSHTLFFRPDGAGHGIKTASIFWYSPREGERWLSKRSETWSQGEPHVSHISRNAPVSMLTQESGRLIENNRHAG